MRRLTMTGSAYTYPKEVAELVASRVEGVTEDASYIVELFLKELLQNVFEHAESSVGCIAHARWYVRDGNVRLAVVDAGIGIPSALRRRRVQGMQRLVDADVIAAAVTQEKLSSRLGGRPGGLGLKHVREFVVQRQGSVTVISQGAKVTFGSKGIKKVKSLYFGGTAVEIDVRPAVQPRESDKQYF